MHSGSDEAGSEIGCAGRDGDADLGSNIPKSLKQSFLYLYIYIVLRA